MKILSNDQKDAYNQAIEDVGKILSKTERNAKVKNYKVDLNSHEFWRIMKYEIWSLWKFKTAA